MYKKNRLRLSLIAVAALLTLQTDRADSQAVEILVPAFAGPTDQGLGASFVLKLQLQLQEKSEDSGPSCKGSEGPRSRAAIVWVPGSLDGTTREAKQLAILEGAQAVVWGSVSNYVDGVLISPYLSVVDSDTDLRSIRPERQVVTTPVGSFLLGHPGTGRFRPPAPENRPLAPQPALPPIRLGYSTPCNQDSHLR